MNNPFSLVDKTILVTGASSNIGKSIALKSSEAGASVLITGRNQTRLEETLSKLDGVRQHRMMPFDLSDLDHIADFVKELPVLDGVVMCAAIFDTTTIRHIKASKVEEIFRTNTFANINLVQQLVKQKKIQRGGSIVFISSVASTRPYLGNSLYSATKGAINSFSRVLALEMGPMKIRVNSIHPGMVERDTGLFERAISVEEQRKESEKFPLGFGEPQDIAYATVYMLSDASKWVTGTDMIVDGGQSII